jgi:putative membrane protein
MKNKTLAAAMVMALAPLAGTAAAADRAGADFMVRAARAGAAEVELGRLATQRGDERDVRRFAEQMVNDHSRLGDDLRRLAAREGVRLPVGMDANHRAALNRLRRMRGDAFDRAYARQMNSDHEQAVALFRQQARNGRDRDVRDFAQQALQTLEHHRQMARDLFREERRETRY